MKPSASKKAVTDGPSTGQETNEMRSLCLNDLDGFVELERQHGFRRHFDRATLSQNLGQSATARAGAGSDHSTFPASCNRPDNCAESCGATGIFGGTLVRSQPLLAALL